MEDFVVELLKEHGPVVAVLASIVEWLRRRLNRCDEDHKECLSELQKVNDKLSDFAMKLVPKQPRDANGRFRSNEAE